MSTAKDVAKLTGVSVATVIRILNDDPRYSFREETRAKVTEAAEKLGYTAVKRRRSEKKPDSREDILFVSTHAINVVIDGVQRACDELGYNLLIRICERSQDESFIPYLEDGDVKAVIFFDYVTSKETLDRYKNVAFVQINEYSRNPDMVSVVIDEFNASKDITDFLIGADRTRIAVVSYNYASDRHVPLIDRRKLGVESSLAQAGHRLRQDFYLMDTPNGVADGGENEEEQYIINEFRKILRLSADERPDAVICNGAKLAALCLRTIQREGLSVPDDVALVCCSSDDYTSFNVLEFTNPTISGIFIPLRDMGREAVYAADAVLKRADVRYSGIMLPYKLVFRESTPGGKL